jgi:RNA polymerase sigma-70 factor (family 1)
MQDTSELEYTTLSDTALVRLLRSSDEGAFREIYRRYWHPLFLTARRRLYSQENAEEAVQDIFVDIWSRRNQVEILDLKRYLFKSIKYKVINLIKARLIRQEFDTDTTHAGDSGADLCTENEIAYLDLYNAIEVGLLGLPVKTQTIFRLNRLENQSVREISARLSIPERTVEYHITQSLRMLKKHLQDYVLTALLLLTY